MTYIWLLFDSYPVNIYLFKVTMNTLEKYEKYVQS